MRTLFNNMNMSAGRLIYGWTPTIPNQDLDLITFTFRIR